MAKIQDIDIPYLEFAEAAAPGTPAATISRLYVKSDGLFYSKDDAGVETLVSGGAAGSSAFVGARAKRTTNLAITTATFSPVTLPDAEDYDTNTIHDTSTNSDRLTIPTSQNGYWHFEGWVSFANSTAGTFRLIRLLKNGTSVAEQSVPFHTNVGVNGAVGATLSVVATDYVSLDCYQDTGGNLNVTAAALSGYRIPTA